MFHYSLSFLLGKRCVPSFHHSCYPTNMSDIFQFDSCDLKITYFRFYFICILHCKVEYLLSWSKWLRRHYPVDTLATEHDKEVNTVQTVQPSSSFKQTIVWMFPQWLENNNIIHIWIFAWSSLPILFRNPHCSTEWQYWPWGGTLVPALSKVYVVFLCRDKEFSIFTVWLRRRFGEEKKYNQGCWQADWYCFIY